MFVQDVQNTPKYDQNIFYKIWLRKYFERGSVPQYTLVFKELSILTHEFGRVLEKMFSGVVIAF